MKKKILAAAVLVMAAAFAVSGCGKESGTKEKLSVSIFDRGTVPAAEGSYEENRWTKWINENSDFEITWVPIPRNEVRQKFNMLIAAGDAPDLMWDYDRDYIAQLVAQDAIMPIDDILENNSTVYKKYLEEHPELKPYITFDKKIYAVSSKRANTANFGVWIRQDWLDKLGLKTPKTDEELLDVARAFRDGDPDGNGIKDTIPFALSGNDLIANFFKTSKNSWYIKDGKMVYGCLTDNYKDMLQFRQTAYKEGLIDPEFITDTNNQRQQQLVTTGKAGIYLAAWDIQNIYTTLIQNDPDAKLVPLEAISTKYGQSGYYQEPPANRYVVFNKNIKNPEAAMKFLDWMLDKGWFTITNGIENENFRYEDGIPFPIDAEKNKTELNYANEYAVVSQEVIYADKFEERETGSQYDKQYAKIKKNALDTALMHPCVRDIPYNPSFAEFSSLQAELDPLIDTIVTNVTIGKDGMTPEAAAERIKNEYERRGGDHVQELAQQWYEENKDSFND